jgi:alpha/beta superfamily hydrolase
MAMRTDTKQSLAQRWEAYQPSKSTLAWACATTAVATMIVGFSWGGWVTGGTSLAQAKAAGDMSRSELASVICVDKFNAASDKAAQLTALNAITDSYKRRQFVEAGGWATMPGQTSPDRRAAEGCAAALAA